MKLPIATNRTITRRLLALLAHFKGEFAFVIAIQLVMAAAAVVTPWVIGATFDAVAAGKGGDVVRWYVGVLAAAVVLQSLTAWLADYKARVLGQKVFNLLRVQLVETITHLPLSVVEAAGTGDLLGRTTADVNRVEFFIRSGLSRLMVVSIQVIATVVAAFLVAPAVGIVVVVSFIPLAIVLRKYLRRTVAGYLASSALMAEFSGDITETVEQSATVDALRMKRARMGRFMVLLEESWNNERYTSWMRVIYVASTVMVLCAPMILAVLWGAWMVGLGLATVGAVTSVALYAQQLRWPLDEFGWWIDELQFASVALARIFGVGEVAPDRVATASAPDADDVVIEDVSFSYRDGRPVLRNVSLDIRPGERLAIVGPSGAGKSTLGRLIAGVNAPGSGSITVGGVEVTRIVEKELHSTCALVTQENHVFAGTIADNLRFAKAAATDVELQRALEIVDAGWVALLPDGLETKVGSGQKDLTPSQAQQLALARIVLLDPSIVILDEATSLLDPTAARSAEQAMNRVLDGRTVISIAHRLYTAYDADRVAVMVNGQVRELGSHEELVATGGEYASLWHAWQQD
ncbi:ABC-type multidrug transport system fused ATPase/permease subunit [Arcanobacterium wilhelmae]|uniref:ABC-type multidrug transport system fused ATPase/permease subunit n=1 Tax=Arcanobacterium wilhelmae TaxID=1803177 RepID=A0ABT9ND73_9ACTO|nr:ABC transporter ATP-binding protein [Arcanobacterium wilhelmae]MDP9801316.1 ABC-type multidrug transport system fused ATPase/permease subunit [Arcanobacterium wilhelmae]WFN90657.1 ABC transporter ATP-binding protein [Arcanobacterium wilhelmae]